MKNLKSHFWYNKRQRNGIFFLLLLIVLFQLIYFFVVPIIIGVSSNEISTVNNNEIEFFQKQLDSLRLVAIEKRKPKIYPFNPSFITNYKGSQLGMSNKEIDKWLKHRQEGKYINSAKEFQSVTKISDSLLAIISPHFKFPDWVNKKITSSKENKKIVIPKDKISVIKPVIQL